MKLRKVSIAGYRSIRERLDLDLDDRITVVLGANDHGKTNALHAIAHLNPVEGFEEDRDLNWDFEDREDEFPRVDYVLSLSQAELDALLGEQNEQIRINAIREFRSTLEEAAGVASETAAEASAAASAAEKTAAELREAVADDESEPALGDAEVEDSRLSAVAADLAEEAVQARQRVVLAEAEEMRIRADLDGEEAVDFEAVAEEAASQASRASTNAKRAETRSETLDTAYEQAQTAHAAGSKELVKAEKEAQTAKTQAAAAVTSSQEAQREAERLRRIADAVKAANDGDLRFETGAEPPKPQLLKPVDLPASVTLSRVGLAGELEVTESGILDAASLGESIFPRLPRVELIRPQETLADVATRDTIDDEGHDFMRGIFRYAGLEPEEWAGLFDQSDRTTKRLDRANVQLNKTLREAWSQGSDLEFKLDHEEGEIHLRIGDPAVEERYVRASRRSSGFTHFFALKTMLYARQRASDASSFVWLFDEPGIYLHPEGQHDLLQVLETLAQANQIIYSTHSIFLINKNYPTRHRLLKKDEKGTGIDQKPFAGQWRAAIDALGLAFPGTILFASKILLVEGDSDPILINSDLQKLIELGEFAADINSLSIMATGDSKHADALIRIFLDSALQPMIALLFDGDQGGGDRRKNLKKLIESKGLESWTLTPAKSTIEDHILAPELFREASILHAVSMAEEGADAAKIRGALEESYEENAKAGSEKKALAEWARSETKRVMSLDDDPSSIGIAREYGRLLADAAPAAIPAKSRKRAIELASKIAEVLELPSQLVENAEIVESE